MQIMIGTAARQSRVSDSTCSTNGRRDCRKKLRGSGLRAKLDEMGVSQDEILTPLPEHAAGGLDVPMQEDLAGGETG